MSATQILPEVLHAFNPPSVDDVVKAPELASDDSVARGDDYAVLPVVDKVDLLQDQNHSQVTFFVDLHPLDHDCASSPKESNNELCLTDKDEAQKHDGADKVASAPTTGPAETINAESIDSPVTFKSPPGLHVPSLDPLPDPAVTPALREAAAAVLLSEPDGVDALSDSTSSLAVSDILSIDPTIFDDGLGAYSLRHLQSLQTFIPDSLFPDELLVHDLDDVTRLCDSTPPSHPVRYVRVYPKFPQSDPEASQALADRAPDASANVANLYLCNANRIGEGNHGSVYSAPLTLRLDPESSAVSRVSVAVKTALRECGAHLMLHREGVLYDTFPRRIMEDRVVRSSEPDSADSCAPEQGEREEGDTIDEPTCAAALPQPDAEGASMAAEREGSGDRAPEVRSSTPVVDAVDADEPSPNLVDIAAPDPNVNSQVGEANPLQLLPAIVPKFFGYYSPVNAEGTLLRDNPEYGNTMHHVQDRSWPCRLDSECRVYWPTSILLLEECGRPIYSFPGKLSVEARRGCYELFERLHDEGFVQNSAYARNILVQPGPLDVPRRARSLRTPSFRIIDFGRGQTSSSAVPGGGEDIGDDVEYEMRKAKRELLL